jgi:hypothetical protein
MELPEATFVNGLYPCPTYLQAHVAAHDCDRSSIPRATKRITLVNCQLDLFLSRRGLLKNRVRLYSIEIPVPLHKPFYTLLDGRAGLEADGRVQIGHVGISCRDAAALLEQVFLAPVLLCSIDPFA